MNLQPSGYEPDELPIAPPRDVRVFLCVLFLEPATAVYPADFRREVMSPIEPAFGGSSYSAFGGSSYSAFGGSSYSAFGGLHPAIITETNIRI